MPLTRAFKSGNSQAVRIPAELAYEDMNVDLAISRHGDVIVIAPARRNLTEVVAALRAMPKPPGVEIYEPTELPDRERD
ncbi:MAG: AbrB family transcriptional regulator [Roseiarcus sp.]